MPRIKGQDRKSVLEEKLKQTAAKLREINAKEKAQARKDDARRKIVAGALAIEHMEKNPNSAFSVKMRELLAQYVDPKARHLFPILQAPAPQANGQDGGTPAEPSHA